MNLNCIFCNGTGWKLVTTQGQSYGGHTYACTTWVRCECCCWVSPSVTVVPDTRAD